MSGFAGGGGAFGVKPSAWDPTVTGIACARLRDAGGRGRDAEHALRLAPDLRVAPAPGVDAALLRMCADELAVRQSAARGLVDELERLHDDTMLAGRAYEWASDAVRHLIEEVAGSVAYALGTAVRGAIFAAAPWAVAIGLVAVPLAARLLLMHPQLLSRITAQAQARGVSVDAFLQQTSGFWDRTGEALMANPVFASALALAVESSDEALAGLIGIPAPLAARFESTVGGDEVLGLMAATAAGGAGLLGGGRVQAVFSRPVAALDAPVTDGAQAMRIIGEQDEQVTIHEFRLADGSTRFQVFVRGTELEGASGLDMEANLENAASLEGAGPLAGRLLGSDAAVAEAMREAGIGPGDAVDLFGHSQGAAAVANVAATGEFDVQTVLMVGGPVAATDLPPGVTALSVAHEGDWVPALDGWADDGGMPTVTVESAGGHGAGAMARHSGEEYVATLEQHDGFVYDAYRERLGAGTAGAVGVAGVGVQLRRR